VWLSSSSGASELIAVGGYDRLDDHRVAEVAFVVADAYQHHGLATMLLHRLAEAARSAGIERFISEVLAENRAMLSVFHDVGFPIESKTESGTVTLTMTIAPDVVPQRPIRGARAREPESRLRPSESRSFRPVSRLDSAG
jgi:GNAT superfamily N-acetyltransferase